MRPRPGSAHAEALARRLELLDAELAAVRPAEEQDPFPDDGRTRVRADRIRPAADLPAVDLPAADIPGADDGAAPAPVPVPGRHARRRTSPLPGLLEGRVALTPAHLTLVAVLALLGLAGTTWWALRAGADPGAMPVPRPAAATPVALATPAAEDPPDELVVDVAGKVRRPGIAVLPPGSRVVDALEAAGGARPGVDLSSLNLARVLVDGEQVLVGVPPPPGAPAAGGGGGSATAAGPVNLNTASADQLESLPGVGPVTAEAIVAFRAEQGGFTSVDQLLDVRGIGEATLAEIKPHVTV